MAVLGCGSLVLVIIKDGEMGIFYNPSKIMKLMLFILIDGTSKQHKRMPQKVLNQSLKELG